MKTKGREERTYELLEEVDVDLDTAVVETEGLEDSQPGDLYLRVHVMGDQRRYLRLHPSAGLCHFLWLELHRRSC